MKQWAFYGVLVTGLALATLVLAEVAFRAFFPQLNPATQLVFYSQNPWQVPLGLPGETYRHRHNAGDFDVEVRFNALGLRDVADIRQARPGDWLYVGDSFGFGFGVDEHVRVSSRLDSLLPGARVFNLSSPTQLVGYGRLLDYARDLGVPDSAGVVRQVFTGNDLFDYESVAPAHTPHTGWVAALRFRLSTQLALYQAGRYLVWNMPVVSGYLAERRAVSVEEGFPVRYDASVIASSVAQTGRVLEGRAGAVVVVVAPPKSYWLGSQSAEWQRIHRAYVSGVEALGYRVVDASAVLDPSHYLLTDGHWNATGHAVVAEAVLGAMGE